MGQRKTKLIIFDYDGVIVNSVEWNAKSFIASFKKMGHLIKKEDFIIGEALEAQFNHVAGKYHIIPDFEEFRSYFENEQRRNKKFVKINRGFPHLIKKLSQYYPLVIVSNNLVKNIEKRIEGCNIRNCFKKIVGLEKERQFAGITKRERLSLILEEFCLRGPETMLVDDIPKHIEVAHRLGIRTIAYLYKHNQHMKFSGRSHVVRSAKEIEKYFLS